MMYIYYNGKEILAENSPNLAKDKYLELSLANPKHDKPKETHVSTHYSQTSENSR